MRKSHIYLWSFLLFSLHMPLGAHAANSGVPTQSAQTQDLKELSLDEVIQRIIQQNPQLWRLRSEHSLWNARIQQASLGTNPELSLVAEDILGSAAFTSDRFTQVTLALAQTVLLSDKLNLRTHLAQLNQQIQYWDYVVQAHELVTQAYLLSGQLSNLQAEWNLLQDLIQNTQEIHHLLSISVERGKLAGTALYQSESLIQSLQAEAFQIRLKQLSAKQALAALWGDSETDFLLKSDLKLNKSTPQEDLLSALKQHPRLARWQIEAQQRNTNLELAQAQASPDLTVSGGVRYHALLDWGLVLSFNLPMPFFNQQQGNIEEARLRKDTWNKELQFEEKTLHNQLQQHYVLAQNQQHWIDLLQKNQVLAEQHNSSTIKAFEAGKLGYIDVLNALQNEMNLRRQLHLAQSEQLISRIKIIVLTEPLMPEALLQKESF